MFRQTLRQCIRQCTALHLSTTYSAGVMHCADLTRDREAIASAPLASDVPHAEGMAALIDCTLVVTLQRQRLAADNVRRNSERVAAGIRQAAGLTLPALCCRRPAASLNCCLTASPSMVPGSSGCAACPTSRTCRAYWARRQRRSSKRHRYPLNPRNARQRLGFVANH